MMACAVVNLGQLLIAARNTTVCGFELFSSDLISINIYILAKDIIFSVDGKHYFSPINSAVGYH